ncbi:P-loop containing nucleoside triphosphate hydrolase protein [Lentinus tigrinus ALCF2SS1-7]|uniref:P-loop containing nucleoside triphosphate hydrolase protein n=1 Tax=Lentinus tigrinus ALCF2SS1-6 TaxID=1328759 RepID=A0A5C2RXB5_9APHY|nr:P-loop containing nucleoside triphosphate hydrolase protein [Lentinus tigrinus ALCF2SS1-6]RPD69103.1 P-loop containing nucleoside triphosphate hydrolase protein [Lentinus tigrinus ALCF2SS1-7]
MFRTPQLVNTQCRHALSRSTLPRRVLTVPPVLARTRTYKAGKSGGRGRPSSSRSTRPFDPYPTAHQPRHHDLEHDSSNKLRLSSSNVAEYLEQNVSDWYSKSGAKTVERLLRFGVSKDAARPLLKVFRKHLEAGDVFRDLAYGDDHLARMARDLSSGNRTTMDRYCTKILYEWASHPQGQQALEATIPHEVISRMQTLFHAADLSRVSWQYTPARMSPPRKFIMHVGPTNSGKTHNALRALAAAERGIYAGPLRLLAHEIYDRLNKGQIVPLGMDPSPEAEPDSQTGFDLGEDAETGKKQVAVTKTGNAKFVRLCNMVTGEEQKIVSPDATLLSCTVEMTPLRTYWDVAVIDEIQLIADKQRGGAWTGAVLGLNAREIHLCGEESAIPLIEAIVRDLGDTLEVHHYKRLTPLVVAEKSLEGDLGKVQAGDCVVAFSRSGLFGLKHSIEKATKMRCALAYGRLPPEIRSEQAALFNDPRSDYRVLVGSDAVGMGLNLKIKRVVFESVAKWDGVGMRLLSASQIKQIAGRAGRFGLHDSDAAGVVTTLHGPDLQVVRKALAASFEPLHLARLNMTMETVTPVVHALPFDAKGSTIGEVFLYVSKMLPVFQFQDVDELTEAMKTIDSFTDCLTLEHRLLVQNSPCPWRDNYAVDGARSLLEIYREKLQVRVEEVLHRGRLLSKLNRALVLMQSPGRSPDNMTVVQLLSTLETVHKVLDLYLWFSYRLTLAFPDQKNAFKLRRLTELVMDWCLEVMHQTRLGARDAAAEARKAVMGRRPQQEDEDGLEATKVSMNPVYQENYHDPNGTFVSSALLCCQLNRICSQARGISTSLGEVSSSLPFTVILGCLHFFARLSRVVQVRATERRASLLRTTSSPSAYAHRPSPTVLTLG